MALIINCLLVISSAVFFIEVVLAIIATKSPSMESGQIYSAENCWSLYQRTTKVQV